MTSENTKKIEKKAKALLLAKNITPDKMDIVHSLLYNKSLSKDEKYSAIIDIIRTCRDKTPEKNKISSIEASSSAIKNYFIPAESSRFINQLFNKYKSLKLFKKRYLIHANNRLGIGFQKRLIPGKRLLKALRDIVSYQEKILSRLPAILMEILKDENIDDASHFNYLRVFRRWMLETPLIKYDMYEIKWMSPAHLEAELESYVTNLFSFARLDIETKEQIILLVENKLRLLDDLRKEQINAEDSALKKNEKEKRNLARENIVYEYMLLIRSFLQAYYAGSNKGNILSEHLKVKFGINSFPDLLHILMEVLVFQRNVEINDIIQHYKINPYKVSSENWDYSVDFLKEIGKDNESRKRKHLEKLKNELSYYNELYSLLKLKVEARLVLENAFDTQWKIADKKQKEYDYIYNEDFLTFIDECINYFNNTYTPLLNGSEITFKKKDEAIVEGNLFTPGVFIAELSGLSNLINELYLFKSSNPRMLITREEAKKIMQGKTRSMFEVERFILITADIFYQIAEKIHRLYDQHRLWLFNNLKIKDPETIHSPLRNIPDDKEPAVIPFFNCTIIDIKDKRILTDKLKGNIILTDSTRGGVIINLCAFSYQLAYECFSDKILSALSDRKELQKKIANAEV